MKIAIVALLCLLPVSATAAVWECVDGSGNKRFTNVKAEASGCTQVPDAKPTPVQPYDSRYFTVEHGSQRFDTAMHYAGRYCAQAKLMARHLGTDTPPGAPSISRFECIKKQ